MAIENVTAITIIGVLIGQMILTRWSLLIGNTISFVSALALVAYAPEDASRAIGMILFLVFVIKTIVDMLPKVKKKK